MDRIQDLEKEITLIKERNKRVEVDKAWEGSFIRKILLICFTYLAIGVYLWVVGIPDPWLNAIVPAVAFTLSTLSLPFIKRIWVRYLYKK